MKTLTKHITERLQLNKDRVQQYKYVPDTKQELREILEERLKKDKNADLNDIDVSKITDMGAKDLGKVEDEYGFVDEMGLFECLDPHNIKINSWNVSNVEDMTGMFCGCKNFNADLSDWNVSKVKSMNSMFRGCENFNGTGLENWNVLNVRHMCFMFANTPFNQDISQWNVSNVRNMKYMFNESKFNQDLTSWKSKIKDKKQLQYIKDYIK